MKIKELIEELKKLPKVAQDHGEIHLREKGNKLKNIKAVHPEIIIFE